MLTKILLLSCLFLPIKGNRSFEIDYANNQFLLDGKPYRYIAGAMHYFQVPATFWRQRLVQLRAMGCNAVQTYISWNWHQKQKNKYDFSERLNFTEYFRIAQSLNLSVILRLGPYIDGEQDAGGFPAWLQTIEPPINFRTFDPQYIAEVGKWYNKLLPMIKPQLYPNGGPIIMAQVENEYGSYKVCDRKYLDWLVETYKEYLGEKGFVYFTTDGGAPGYLHCTIPGIYATVDFGINSLLGVQNAFKSQRTVSPRGPLVNSEFYPGWFDMWEGGHSKVGIQGVIDTISYMYQMNASFTIYMIHGGTNFGYQAGSEYYDRFRSITTSYDFDAPISEAGILTPKYFAIRETIERITGKSIAYPVPPATELYWFGTVEFRSIGTIFDHLSILSPHVIQSQYPLSAEASGQNYGFVLYETTLPAGVGTLNISGANDRAYVFFNGKLQQIIQRTNYTTATLIKAMPNAKLQILIENQGRICYGSLMNDQKGLVENVTIGNKIVTNWRIYPLNFSNLIHHHRINGLSTVPKSRNRSFAKGNNTFIPSIYVSSPIVSPRPTATYLDLSGWSKGQAFTGKAEGLGRYWPSAGPQITLYHPFIDKGNNTLILFELEKAGNCKKDLCYARLINFPLFK